MKKLGHLLVLIPLSIGCCAMNALAAESAFNGLDLSLGNLYRVSKAQSRSISPENFTGEKGKAGMATEGTGKGASRELGKGWKVSPSVRIEAGKTFTLGEIKGPGCIQQIWMTPAGNWRHAILRFYWDDETEPSVECPVGDFFACAGGKYCQISSLPVCVNPGSAFNCYWQMPFRKKARITMENRDAKGMTLYYQINYTLTDIPKDAGYFHAQLRSEARIPWESRDAKGVTLYCQVNYTLTDIPKDAGYFHAQFRREAPLQQKGLYTILDGIEGQGQYVGTYLAWEVHSPGWWGEGEIKFFLDGDKEFPTICGTGTEDYFCGSYNFETRTPDGKKRYTPFSTPYTGLAQVLPPDKNEEAGQQFGLYRWHIADPVRFEQDLKVTIQALGWQTGGRPLAPPQVGA